MGKKRKKKQNPKKAEKVKNSFLKKMFLTAGIWGAIAWIASVDDKIAMIVGASALLATYFIWVVLPKEAKKRQRSTR